MRWLPTNLVIKPVCQTTWDYIKEGSLYIRKKRGNVENKRTTRGSKGAQRHSPLMLLCTEKDHSITEGQERNMIQRCRQSSVLHRIKLSLRISIWHLFRGP